MMSKQVTVRFGGTWPESGLSKARSGNAVGRYRHEDDAVATLRGTRSGSVAVARVRDHVRRMAGFLHVVWRDGRSCRGRGCPGHIRNPRPGAAPQLGRVGYSLDLRLGTGRLGDAARGTRVDAGAPAWPNGPVPLRPSIDERTASMAQARRTPNLNVFDSRSGTVRRLNCLKVRQRQR